MSDNQSRQRLTMPGEGPTDEDLHHDVELTRQELADTVDALAAKVDVKERVREKKAEIGDRGDELVAKLPDPVANRVRPVVASATRRPAATLGGMAAILALLGIWWRFGRR
jgi:hypothetical protein